jgi:gluconolactonase
MPMTLSLAESPLWDTCERRLLFVDVTASTLYALSDSDEVSVVATDLNNTNGIAFDVDGSLILAQMGAPGHIARRAKDGKVTMIDPAGPALHTPDDVIVRSDGTIYFTDGEFPPIGGINFSALPVYAITPGATMLLSGGTVAGPNGIELSPDEKTLYVDAYFQGAVIKFDVAEDGSLTKAGTLATGLLTPDSLCLDAEGNLYVAVTSGLQVLRPDGTSLGVISVGGGRAATNCAFGGEDGKTLYISAWTSLWKVPGMPTPGLTWQNDKERLDCAANK